MATRRAHELAAFNYMDDGLKEAIIGLINSDRGVSENFVLFDFRVNIQRNRDLFNQFKYFNKIILNQEDDSIPTFEIGGKHFPVLSLKSYDNRPGTFRDFFIDNGMDRNSLLRVSSASEAFNFWKYKGRNITNNTRRAGTLRGNYNNKFDNIALLCIIAPGNRAVYDLDRSKLDSLGDLNKKILIASDTDKKDTFAFRMLGYKYKMKSVDVQVAVAQEPPPQQVSRQEGPPEINIGRMLKETGGDMRYRNRMRINKDGTMAKKFATSKSVRDAILYAIQNDTADKKDAFILLRNITSFEDSAKYFEDGYIMELKKMPIDNIYIAGIFLNLSLIKDNFFTYGPGLDFSNFNSEQAEQFKGILGPTWNAFMEKVEKQKSEPENLMTPSEKFAQVLENASYADKVAEDDRIFAERDAARAAARDAERAAAERQKLSRKIERRQRRERQREQGAPREAPSTNDPPDLLGFDAFPLLPKNNSLPKLSLSGYTPFGRGGARKQTKKKKN